MRRDVFAVDAGDIRGADSNSLLHLYDLASEGFNRATSRQERDRAGRALRRITTELRKRNVSFTPRRDNDPRGGRHRHDPRP